MASLNRRRWLPARTSKSKSFYEVVIGHHISRFLLFRRATQSMRRNPSASLSSPCPPKIAKLLRPLPSALRCAEWLHSSAKLFGWSQRDSVVRIFQG